MTGTRSPKIMRPRPSAIWLRAELATQRNRMLLVSLLMVQAFDAVAESVAHAAAATWSSVMGWTRGRAQGAPYARPMSTGALTSGPRTAANGAPLWMRKLAMATAMASSKLLE